MFFVEHYCDVIMGKIASQITSLTIVYSAVYSGTYQRKHQKLRVTGLCVWNSPGTGEFPAQMASIVENVSIWWRHNASGFYPSLGFTSPASGQSYVAPVPINEAEYIADKTWISREANWYKTKQRHNKTVYILYIFHRTNSVFRNRRRNVQQEKLYV